MSQVMQLTEEGKCECDNCDWKGDASDLDMISDFEERVTAGCIVPAGQCPECSALAYLTTDALDNWHPQREIEALQAKVEALTNSLSQAKSPLAVILDGGLVQAIVSTNADAAPPVYVIDYDVEGSDRADLTKIPQGDGTEAEDAFARAVEVTTATIDISTVISEISCEAAARAAGWVRKGDGDGYIFHKDHYSSWKQAVSWAGDGGPNDNGPIYDSWKECCESENIEVA